MTARSASRPTTITVVPNSASRPAVSRPIPLVPPVTRQTLPELWSLTLPDVLAAAPCRQQTCPVRPVLLGGPRCRGQPPQRPDRCRRADPRTTMRYDRTGNNLDRRTNHNTERRA
jgi:hypothetical protein